MSDFKYFMTVNLSRESQGFGVIKILSVTKTLSKYSTWNGTTQMSKESL